MNFLYLLLVLAAGVALALQIGVNNALRAAVGNPVLAALISFVIGGICLMAWALLTRMPWPSPQVVTRVAPWTLLGGMLGAFYVVGVITAAPRLGAANVISSVVAAQMITSLLMDHYGLIGFAQHGINLWRIAGALLLVTGTVLILRN